MKRRKIKEVELVNKIENTEDQSPSAAKLNQPYGAIDLKKCYRPYLIRGLAISLIVHCAIIGAYWISLRLSAHERKQGNFVILSYTDLGPPPSIHQEITSSVRFGSLSSRKLDFGVPIPIPNFELKAEKEFPTQEELSQSGNPQGEGGDGINIPDSVRADFAGDDMEGVTPDVPPVLLTMTVPRYPELALRQKISGTVWVRVLVDQHGGVKSAAVQKSDAEILNQAALEAARKCLFTPGLYRKRAIAAWVSIPIEFKLEQE